MPASSDAAMWERSPIARGRPGRRAPTRLSWKFCPAICPGMAVGAGHRGRLLAPPRACQRLHPHPRPSASSPAVSPSASASSSVSVNAKVSINVSLSRSLNIKVSASVSPPPQVVGERWQHRCIRVRPRQAVKIQGQQDFHDEGGLPGRRAM